MNAELLPMVEGGKIRQILVQDGGQMYASTELAVSGTGGSVDAVAIFSETGINTDTIFDDPDLLNVEFDRITTAKGAGHGFIERPWSWDGQRLNTEVPANSYKLLIMLLCMV